MQNDDKMIDMFLFGFELLIQIGLHKNYIVLKTRATDHKTIELMKQTKTIHQLFRVSNCITIMQITKPTWYQLTKIGFKLQMNKCIIIHSLNQSSPVYSNRLTIPRKIDG